tara:strand:+ start:24995 stop:25225 length:231 start_codon:yes stop_codon:yes gene_type:complete
MEDKQIIDFYNQMNLKDIELFIQLASCRIRVPIEKKDKKKSYVFIDDIAGTCINGAFIDLITEEFEKSIIKERDGK